MQWIERPIIKEKARRLKTDIFDETQIRQLIKNPQFVNSTNKIEINTRNSGENIHQVIRILEEIYQKRWNVQVMADKFLVHDADGA